MGKRALMLMSVESIAHMCAVICASTLLAPTSVNVIQAMYQRLVDNNARSQVKSVHTTGLPAVAYFMSRVKKFFHVLNNICLYAQRYNQKNLEWIPYQN